MERLDLRRRRRSGSRPARRRSPRRSAWARRSTTCTRVGMDARRRPRARADRATRWTAWPTVPGVRDHRPADAVDRGGAVSFAVDGIHPHDVGQVLDDRGRRGAGRAPLRLAAARAGSGCRPRRGRRSHLYNDARRRSTRWSPACAHAQRLLRGGVMQLEPMYQEIILDHYQHPHGRGLREPFDAEVHHVNPTCGDEVTLRVRARRRATRSPTSPTTARAARSARRRRRC